LQIYY